MGRKIKAKAPRTVAGDEKKGGSRPGGGKGAGLLQHGGGEDGAEALGQAEGEHGIRFQAEEGGVGMIINRASGPVGEVSRVPDVVPVTVGQEEGVRFELSLF